MNFVYKKLKSGALQFTIFISVLIAIILAGIILLVYTNSFFRQQNSMAVNNIVIANNAIHTICNNNYSVGDTITLNNHDTIPGQKVTAIVSHWGIFEKALTKATYKNKIYTKCALLGSIIPQGERQALYLKETYTPLAVVGNTKIEGNASLPKEGVRTGNIAGHSYYGKELIFGNIYQSTEELPMYKYNLYDVLSELKNYAPKNDSSYINIHNKISTNSFAANTKIYRSSNTIILDNITLKGNILIISTEEINVKKNAILEDVILVAPTIKFESEFIGNLQAVAEKHIYVGKKCNFNYPSALILLKKETINEQNDSKIIVDKETNLSGIVCYLKKDDTPSNYITNISVAIGCRITGEIVCEGNLDLRGKVKGSVYASQLITNEMGTIFVNHLYDAVINSNDLHPNFGGMLWKDKPKTVAKWVY